MNRLVQLLDLAPRAYAAVGGAAGLAAGLYLSWVIVDGSGPARWVAGLGMLLVVTPLLVLVATAFNFALASALVLPARRAITSRVARRPQPGPR